MKDQVDPDRINPLQMISGAFIFCDYNHCPMSPHFPIATQIPFADFNNRYVGQSCYLVGRGPTQFDYEKLANVATPIFFINDAVSLEKYAKSETFFVAHDAQMLVWLNGAIRSTVVIPIDGKIFRTTSDITLQHSGKIAFYHWRENKKEDLLRMTRDQIAEIQQLYTHTGTIHSALHFIWFCGFTQVSFIGCDGHMGVDYDTRIANRSNSSAVGNYGEIARAQRLLTMLFGIEAIYL